MKRTVIIVGLLLCSLSQAYATTHFEMHYRDLIRPHGQARSDAVYNSALDFCYGQTGLAREAADTRAFKDCMSGRGYRWLSTKLVQDPPSRRTQNSSNLQKGDTFIEP